MLTGACSKAPNLEDVESPELQCVPRGLGAEGLGTEWQSFAGHVYTCVVLDPDGIPALEIIGVSVPGLDQSRSAPRPLILLPGGRMVGRLPYQYPQDAGRSVRLRFEAWHHGIPERIGIGLADTVAPSSLMWNGERRVYETQH